MVLLLAVGCASPAFPRGAPEEFIPPRLVSVNPENESVNFEGRAVEFQFDEVISERPAGATALSDVFVISPGTGVARVDWRRGTVVVRPREGFQPNTTYTITMLAGISDLQNNARKDREQVVFSTGSDLATSSISGIIFDWINERPAPRALIRALPAAGSVTADGDTIAYHAVSDSTGHFTIPNLPNGEYHLRGFVDVNSNRAYDVRDLLDSTTITVADSSRVELLAFVHDSMPPRLESVAPRDSFTVVVRFQVPVDPTQNVDTSFFRLFTAEDSVPVQLVLARPERAFERERTAADSARADSVQRADSIARAQRPDSLVLTQAVAPSRPRPPQVFVLQVATPLAPGTRYIVRATGVRGMLGTTQESQREFTIPARTPPVPVDTLRGRRE